MSRELSSEEKGYINELTIKLINDVPVKEVDKWVQSLPDHVQVIIVEAVDIMCKNLDIILKSTNQKEVIAKLLKGEYHETNS